MRWKPVVVQFERSDGSLVVTRGEPDPAVLASRLVAEGVTGSG